MPVEDRDVDVHSARRVPGCELRRTDRRQPGGAGCRNRREPKVSLRSRVGMSGFRVEFHPDQLRAIVDGLLEQVGEICRRCRWQRFFLELKSSLIAVPERGGKLRVRRIEIVLRLHQQKLRLSEIDICEADIKTGLDFVLFESAGLVGYELARLHRLLRY